MIDRCALLAITKNVMVSLKNLAMFNFKNKIPLLVTPNQSDIYCAQESRLKIACSLKQYIPRQF